MITKMKPRRPANKAASGRNAASPRQEPPAHPSADSKVDEMGESSFPASDPPAVWTWEIAKAGPSG